MVGIVQPKLKAEDLASSYGFALATLNSDPSLKKLFKTAVAKQYTPDRFTAELRNTKWWRQNSEAQRKYMVLKTSDPSQYVSQINQTMSAIADQWGQLTGQAMTFTPPAVQQAGGKNKKGKKAKNKVGNAGKSNIADGTGLAFTIADTALRLGWNESQINDALVASYDWGNAIKQNTLGGSASGMLQDWRAKAHAFGINPTDDWYANNLRSVAGGDNDEAGVLGQIKNLAKQRYTAFADDIEAGYTLEDLTQNYRESVGKVLEIPPAQVDVFDKHIQKAVTSRDADGNPVPMNIGDFEDELRKDNRWQYTQNAKDNIVGTGVDVLKSFGLMA